MLSYFLLGLTIGILPAIIIIMFEECKKRIKRL